jgi:hypothetical protein
MHSSITVTKAAPDKGLITLYEAKVALRLDTTSTTDDELLKTLILRSSDEVQVLCARFFPKETVIESFREVVNPITRLYLSRFPVKPSDIISIDADGLALALSTDYEVDEHSGKVTLLTGVWSESVAVNYTGGYDIPQGVPPSLRQATLLLLREAYYSAVRGDSSVRAIAHKESRITYFDPNTALKAMSGSGGGGSGGTAAQRAAKDLLIAYTRLTA